MDTFDQILVEKHPFMYHRTHRILAQHIVVGSGSTGYVDLFVQAVFLQGLGFHKRKGGWHAFYPLGEGLVYS